MQLTFSTQKSNIGTCPHGLPIGSCPICNGMSGGGARKADFSAKPGEMSWNECAAIGAFLRAQKLARQARMQDAINFSQKAAAFAKNINLLHQKLLSVTNLLVNSKFPRVISYPISFTIRVMLVRPIEVFQALPAIIPALNAKIADVSSKIVSVLGEIKTAVYKNVSKTFAEIKKKIKSLFAIFETFNLNNEDKKINEEKRVFNLKQFLHSLKKKDKNNETS